MRGKIDRESFTLSSGREPEHASEELHAAWQVEAVPSPRLQHPTLMAGEDLGTRWCGLELWCLHRSSPVHRCSPRQTLHLSALTSVPQWEGTGSWGVGQCAPPTLIAWSVHRAQSRVSGCDHHVQGPHSAPGNGGTSQLRVPV